MSAGLSGAAISANAGRERLSVNAKGPSAFFSEIAAVARSLWPAKTAKHLAAKAHVSERAAEFWLAGRYEMNLDAARNLLRSEDGYQFLVALVGTDCDAAWFKTVKMNHEHGVLRRSIKAQEKRLDRIRTLRDQLDMFND